MVKEFLGQRDIQTRTRYGQLARGRSALKKRA
jgi:hypothetical protein